MLQNVLIHSFIDFGADWQRKVEWPDLYKQLVSTYSDLGFKVYFMSELSICKSNKYVQPYNCFMASNKASKSDFKVQNINLASKSGI